MGYSYLQSGEWGQAAATIKVALDLNKQSGNQMFYGSSSFLQGLLEYHRGDWAAARHWFEEAQRLYRHASRAVTRAYAPIGPGLIRAITGDLEEGVRYLQEAISICQDEGVPFILHRAQREMAEVDLVLGRAAETSMRLVRSSRHRVTKRTTTSRRCCRSWRGPALSWVMRVRRETLLERAESQAEVQRHYLALLDVLRVRGLLCIKQQNWQEGQKALDQALILARGMAHPYAEAKVLYTKGCLKAAGGDPGTARRQFTGCPHYLHPTRRAPLCWAHRERDAGTSLIALRFPFYLRLTIASGIPLQQQLVLGCSLRARPVPLSISVSSIRGRVRGRIVVYAWCAGAMIPHNRGVR